jgi:kynurenine aminotransferase
MKEIDFEQGHARLLKAISDFYFPLIHRQLNTSDEILVTSGGFDALHTIFMTFLDDEDEVILIEPYFFAYKSLIQLSGGRPVSVPLTLDFTGQTDVRSVSCEAWKLDLNRLREAFTSKTKLLILNNPHNPTGKVFDRATVEAIGRLCCDHNVLIVSDDVYEFSVFDSIRLPRIASMSSFWDHCITIGSAGKTFGLVRFWCFLIGQSSFVV